MAESWLVCDSCGAKNGPHESYEEWSRAASTLRWEVGEEIVVCAECLGRVRD